MRIGLVFLAIGCCHAQTISAVLNAASYTNNLAPGTWAAIFGINLATSTATAQSVPLPDELGGVSVTVGGLPAPLLYVSPGQVNALIPFELPAIPANSMLNEPLVITTTAGSATQQIALTRTAPAVFTKNGSGDGNAIVLNSDFTLATNVATSPIIFYATGLGPVQTPVSSASGATGADQTTDGVVVALGYQYVNVPYAGLAPGFPGVYQINVLPGSPPTNTLQLWQDGALSNPVTVPMPAGTNVSSVSGTITPLYPSGNSPVLTFSELLIAAQINIDLEIKPNANPFMIVALTDVPQGGAAIYVNPAKGTWTASLSEPSAMERTYNFGPNTVFDYTACQAQGPVLNCATFPEDVVPMNRVDPAALSLAESLPDPSYSPSTAGETYYSEGSIPVDGHLVINGSQLSSQSRFAGFDTALGVLLGNGNMTSQTVQFRLFVDGLELDSKTVQTPVY